MISSGIFKENGNEKKKNHVLAVNVQIKMCIFLVHILIMSLMPLLLDFNLNFSFKFFFNN